MTFTAQQPQIQAALAKIGQLQTTWDLTFRGLIERAVSDKLKRDVVLLKGNYVVQKAGVVSYHGPLKKPGAVYVTNGRKGWGKFGANVFHIWLVVK